MPSPTTRWLPPVAFPALNAVGHMLFQLRLALAGSPSQLAESSSRSLLDPCYGLVVLFRLLSTRGYGPDAVTFR
jgi:hypothetical protein